MIRGCTQRSRMACPHRSTSSVMACGVFAAGTVLNRIRDLPSGYFSMMSPSLSLYFPASHISPRVRRCSSLMVFSVIGNFAPCSWMSLSASRYPLTSSSSLSRRCALPRRTGLMRAWSTVTPSILFDDTALSIKACSRRTLSRWGACFVNSSCLPRASPRSARYHDVIMEMVSGFEANCFKVIMSVDSFGSS